MNQRNTVLIVEDDPTLGGAMKAAFERSGVEAVHCTKSDEALAKFKFQSFDAAIIDCMLPKLNGRDLGRRFREGGGKFPIFLMSGIYKDKAFIREASEATLADGFFVKPFDLAKVVEKTLGLLAPPKNPDMISPLHELFIAENSSDAARILAVQSLERIQALEIPWVLSALNHPKISGILEVGYSGRLPAQIHIRKGKIVNVNNPWAPSMVDTLMVEHELIPQDKIEEIVRSVPGATEIRHAAISSGVLPPINTSSLNSIGTAPRTGFIFSTGSVTGSRAGASQPLNTGKEKFEPDTEISLVNIASVLIEAKEISDSGLHRVHTEQAALALSQLINDASVTLSFEETTDVQSEVEIGENDFARVMAEWLQSKIKPAWLKSFYRPWITHRILPGYRYDKRAAILALPLLARTPGVVDHVLNSMNLGQAIETFKIPSEKLYASVHMLIGMQVLRIDRDENVDFSTHKNRLEGLVRDFHSQDHFQRLGVAQSAKDVEVKRAFHEMAKLLNPNRLSASAPPELRELSEKAYAMLGKSYETLMNEVSKEFYLLELQRGTVESIALLEKAREEARVLIGKGEMKRARDILSPVMNEPGVLTEDRLMYLWARLKTMDEKQFAAKAAEIKDQLNEIPPEERHSAMFFVVRGLMLALSGDHAGALKLMQAAVSANPSFIEARRELGILEARRKTESGGLMNRDLGEVFSSMFKRK